MERIQLATAAAGPQPTSEQEAAITGLLGWATNKSGGGCFSTLVGPAGTGKSFTTRLIRKALTDQGFTVGLASPTHKACGVLAKACGVAKDETVTIASLLAMRAIHDGDQERWIRDYRRKPQLDQADIWLIDEASMIEPLEVGVIQQEAQLWNKFIFIGDDAQLSPVNYSKSSPALEFRPCFRLNQVMRHGGPLLEAATKIRKTRGTEQVRIGFYRSQHDQQSSVHVYANREQWIHAARDLAIACHHDNNPDGTRIICYRNEQVHRANEYIRRHIYGFNAPPFINGERLITTRSIKSIVDGDERIIYGRSRELVVLEARRSRLQHPTCADGEPYRCWDLTVITDGVMEEPQKITAIDPTHQGRLAIALDMLCQHAKDTERGSKQNRLWKQFWELRETFAELQPHWALTAHRAQGSQFGEVFLDGHDLDRIKGSSDEIRRIWYTALTRSEAAAHLIADREGNY